MEHIREQYGSQVNYLKLTRDEYKALEPFLLALGVRSRVTQIDTDRTYTIQAENVFKSCMTNRNDREYAEHFLTNEMIEVYQR